MDPVHTIEARWREVVAALGLPDEFERNVWPLVQGEVGAHTGEGQYTQADPGVQFPALVYTSEGVLPRKYASGRQDLVERFLLDFRHLDYKALRALVEDYRGGSPESGEGLTALAWEYQGDGYGLDLVIATGQVVTPRRVAFVEFLA